MHGSIQTFLRRIKNTVPAQSRLTITMEEANALVDMVKERHGPMSPEEFYQRVYLAHIPLDLESDTLNDCATEAVQKYLSYCNEQAVGSVTESVGSITVTPPTTPKEPNSKPTAIFMTPDTDPLAGQTQLPIWPDPKTTEACEPTTIEACTTPKEPDPESMAAHYSMAVDIAPVMAEVTEVVREPERKGLEWRFGFYTWTAQSSRRHSNGGILYWRIRPTEKGAFLLHSDEPLPCTDDPFSTIDAAKAWCQEQDAKL